MKNIHNPKLYEIYKDYSQQSLNNEFINYCIYGELEVVRYLVSSPDLENHADIYANNNAAFKQAYMRGHWDIVEYFIFNYEIEKTEFIKKFIEQMSGDNTDKVKQLFSLRELNKNLNEELPSVNANKKKPKI